MDSKYKYKVNFVDCNQPHRDYLSIQSKVTTDKRPNIIRWIAKMLFLLKAESIKPANTTSTHQEDFGLLRDISDVISRYFVAFYNLS